VGIKLKGQKEFDLKTRQFSVDVSKGAKRANLATGFLIQTATRIGLTQMGARETGGLAASYHLESEGETGGKVYWESPVKRGNGNYSSDDGLTNPGWLHAPIRDKATVLVGSNAPHASPTEFGRSAGARMPPPDALKPWLRRKGLPESMAFPLARAIARRGIQARPAFQNALAQKGAAHVRLQARELQAAAVRLSKSRGKI